MAMISLEMQKITAAARRSDCAFAVVPWGGGSMINPIKSNSQIHPVPGSSSSGSWAKQNGILVFENVKRTPQGFTIDEDEKLSGIFTQLDYRNTPGTGGKTFIAKAYCPLQYAPDITSTSYLDMAGFGYDIIAQGVASYWKNGYVYQSTSPTHPGVKYQCFHLAVWDYSLKKYYPYITCNVILYYGSSPRSFSVYVKNIPRSELFDRFNVFAMQFIPAAETEDDISQLKLFFNGNLVGSSNWVTSGTAPQWYSAADDQCGLHPTMSVCANTTLERTARHTVSWAMGFDSVLTEDEIMDLSTV